MEKEIEQIIKTRIKNNETLFEEKEIQIIKSNFKLIKKIYLLGILDKI